MSAFITNFQSPVEMQDLEDRFRRGGISNLNMLLHWRQFQPLEWIVDKQAVVGDTVLFMCAKTSVDHIGRLYTQIRKAGQKDSALGRFAAAQQALYKICRLHCCLWPRCKGTFPNRSARVGRSILAKPLVCRN